MPQSAVKAVADVLRASTLLSVSEDGYRVKRTLTIGDFAAVEGEVDARSLCIKPFAYDSTVDGALWPFEWWSYYNGGLAIRWSCCAIMVVMLCYNGGHAVLYWWSYYNGGHAIMLYGDHAML